MELEFTPAQALVALPDASRACVLDKPGDGWALRDVPLEHPQAGEVLVKAICCGFRLTDADIQKGRLGPLVHWPTMPGHRFIGDIVEIGPGETRWVVGDRVGGAWHAGHDGTCRCVTRATLRAATTRTSTAPRGAEAVSGAPGARPDPDFRRGRAAERRRLLRHFDRAVAEYCNLRREAAVRIPADAGPIETASFLCVDATIFNAMRQIKMNPGETVEIQGIRGLGHLGIQYARKMGYGVVAISTSDSRRELALQLGAHYFIKSSATQVTEEIKKLGSAKMIIITAPDPNAMTQYTRCLA